MNFYPANLEAVVMVSDVLLVNAQHREEHVEEVTWKKERNQNIPARRPIRDNCSSSAMETPQHKSR